MWWSHWTRPQLPSPMMSIQSHHLSHQKYFKSKFVTWVLYVAVVYLTPTDIGFKPSNVKYCSLRSAEAIDLICENIDSEKIKLPKIWIWDEMLWYLYLQDQIVMHNFSKSIIFGRILTLLADYELLQYTYSHPLTLRSGPMDHINGVLGTRGLSLYL